MVHSFVALDLELTPSSGDQQKIIEIAAARFRDGSLTESYSTFVNPGCDLDPRVVALTGIHQSDLADAPPIGRVLPDFLAFVGHDLLVGQSIDLDLECLSRVGVELPNEAYDTFELASLLLPGLPSYDLTTIARSLGVALEQEHRALGDAVVTGRVCLALADRARQLSLDLLTEINALAAQLDGWPLSLFFAELLRERLHSHFSSSSRGNLPLPMVRRNDSEGLSPLLDALTPLNQPAPSAFRPGPDGEATTVDPLELEGMLKSGGVVSAALDGFEERPEQVRMMAAVAEAFNNGGHLLAEAGTGTGKSLAYLLPAIYYAVRNGRHVVVSTNTLNLQDQLFLKDIPALQNCIPLPFKAALLKGRGNYLCLRRWQVLSRSPNLSREEILLLIKTSIWLAVTESGDRAELNLSTSDATLWPRVSAQAESCALARCPQFRHGNCFVLRARKNAEDAHIIVVNHALLLSDLATSGGVLPSYSHLVIDEAHHLEEEATEQLAFNFRWDDLHSFLAGLHQMAAGQKPAGFLPELAEALRMQPLKSEIIASLHTALSSSSDAVEAAMAEGKAFFEAASCFLHDHAEDRFHSGVRLRITGSVRTQPGWSEVEVRWSGLAGGLRSLERHLHRLERLLQDLDEDLIAERDGLVADIVGFRIYLDRVGTLVDEIVSEPTGNGIYWMSGASALADLALCSAPLHVGEALNTALFSCKDSVVLTSATLTAEGCFDYIKERLSLDDASELVLGSPFDYQRSTLLYVVQDVPEPGRPAYQRALEAAIADLVIALEGRTLVLFTSHAQLRLTNGAIRSRLEEAGILVLAHGIDGSRRRLLQAFKSSPRAVLMGTSSFWEGIDITGEALSCVVIAKLPFAVPTDPIIAARSESFEEPFRQYAVPQTILKFKQGFGRLIRTEADRGIVVILDSRVRSKFYGQSFIQSVPRCTVKIGAASHLAETARNWLRPAGETP